MVKPKPASTLVIMKDNDESASLEILMLLRSHRSSFVPGNYVFPGGGMDSVDNDTALMERWPWTAGRWYRPPVGVRPFRS